MIYVERPGDPIELPPYELSSVRLRCHWLTVDRDRVAALCRATFDEPTGGAVRIRPVGSDVALMFAHIGSVTATNVTPRTTTVERDAGFWIPVRVEQAGKPARLAWFLPHLFVDEPTALMIGREASGFPKSLADAIEMPWEGTGRVTARVRDEAGRLSPRTVMEVVEAAQRGGGSVPTLIAKMAGGELANLRMHFDNVVGRREVPLVLLRQLRAVDDPKRAAHQEVVWLDQRISRITAARVLDGKYELRIGELPVAAALGLGPGTHSIGASVEAELDFTIPGQRLLWTAQTPPKPKRTRVAILGGGIAALATAWRLVTSPGGAERYAITIYEKDHRLGGKCASGRDEEHAHRILEHGLHMWFGCYEESFKFVREVFADVPGGRALHDAFEPQNVFEFWDRREDGTWSPWRLSFPPNDLVPGDGGPLADGPALVRAMIRWVSTGFEMALVPLLRSVLRNGDEMRQMHVTVDLALAALRGIVADGLLVHGFQHIDHEDLRDWLTRHGASPRSIDAGPIRAMYDMTFAYEGGDRARPSLAAGTGLHAILRMLFGYSGAVAWKMRGSMGDVVIAPLYEALRRRGVKFEFFHAVETVTPAGDAIDSIEMRRHAAPRTGEYDPLIEVDGQRCWPERPRAEQLTTCDEPIELLRGRDFDHVVLALPPAVLEHVARPLAERLAGWRTMLASQSSVATTAAQLWFTRSPEAMRGVVVAGCEGPWDTWADMTHTLAAENWNGARPGAVFYGCGPITDDASSNIRLVDYLAADGSPWSESDAIASEYVRFNTHGSERYVQTRPGSTALRLKPDGSGYANLWLAGDWTKTGFDIGSVESAIFSARIAATALAARVAKERVHEGPAVQVSRRIPTVELPTRLPVADSV